MLITCGTNKSWINFGHPDDKKRWEEQCKIQGSDWRYYNLLEDPIHYNHNSLGYRTHEFDFEKDYIAALGCSNTYGLYLHENERYSNLLESHFNIPVYNFGISGGSANLVMMNISNIMTSSKPPKAVIIQWPNNMRIGLPFTKPYDGIYNIRANTEYGSKGKIFEELVYHGNTIETYSLWCKKFTNNLLEMYNIPNVQFSIIEEDSNFYNIQYIEKIDRGFDNSHMGKITNKNIAKYVKKCIDTKI